MSSPPLEEPPGHSGGSPVSWAESCGPVRRAPAAAGLPRETANRDRPLLGPQLGDGGDTRMADHQAALSERHTLHRAHRELEHLLARVETVAETAGMLDASVLGLQVTSLLEGLESLLIPHIAWEEKVCYADIDRLAETPTTTQLLRLQHEQICQRLVQLRSAGLDPVEPHQRMVLELRARLYALHALLSSHLEQEEYVLLTVLVSTTPHGEAR
jgi:iron-sulfur cluster repair protein YtfE (RIC family)